MSKVFLLLALPLTIVSCDTISSKQEANDQVQQLKPEVNTYTTKFAGNYTVKSDSYDESEAKEIYVLKYDGTAKWMFVDVNENIPLDKAKYGIWRVKGSTLQITYLDDNEVEIEHFVLQDGCFYDENSGERYLQLSQLAQLPF